MDEDNIYKLENEIKWKNKIIKMLENSLISFMDVITYSINKSNNECENEKLKLELKTANEKADLYYKQYTEIRNDIIDLYAGEKKLEDDLIYMKYNPNYKNEVNNDK